MLIRTSHRYGSDVESVMAAMVDEGSVREKCSADPDVDLLSYRRDDLGGATTVVQERRLRFPVAPDVAKLLTPELRIHHQERWEGRDPDGGRRATLRLTAPGIPVRALCRLALRPDGRGGTQADLTVDLSCDVPLIGGRVLDAVAQSARAVIEREAAANARILSPHRPDPSDRPATPAPA